MREIADYKGFIIKARIRAIEYEELEKIYINNRERYDSKSHLLRCAIMRLINYHKEEAEKEKRKQIKLYKRRK